MKDTPAEIRKDHLTKFARAWDAILDVYGDVDAGHDEVLASVRGLEKLCRTLREGFKFRKEFQEHDRHKMDPGGPGHTAAVIRGGAGDHETEKRPEKGPDIVSRPPELAD